MNNLYFACCNCKIYLDAGYRWAYWNLEEAGIVKRNEPVNIENVLAATLYWQPPKEKRSDWLYEEVLPPVEQFLYEHCVHQVKFGEIEDFAPIEEDDSLDWLQIGYCYRLTLRYFVEILNFQTWTEVCVYVENQENKPWWWGYASNDKKYERKFEALVRQQDSG